MTTPVCKIADCETSKIFARGMCVKHYKRVRRNGDPNKLVREQHNKRKTSEYQIWTAMKQRCYNKKIKQFDDYGGRGIEVCNRWLNSFSNFLEDMGERPTQLHSIDRIDNDGNYSPDNCRWATKSEQQINQRIRLTNKSGKTGVFWDAKRGKWLAYITIGGKRKYFGYFSDFDDAVEARLYAEQHRFEGAFV